eukprot:s1838_g24.t1
MASKQCCAPPETLSEHPSLWNLHISTTRENAHDRQNVPVQCQPVAWYQNCENISLSNIFLAASAACKSSSWSSSSMSLWTSDGDFLGTGLLLQHGKRTFKPAATKIL